MRRFVQKKTIIVLALVLTAASLVLVFFIKNRQPPPKDIHSNGPRAVVYSTDSPEEEKPKASDWQGKPADPKRIIIPSVSIDAYLQNVGVDQNQQIAVPTNVHIGGWFVDSVLPGEPGLSIIDGHVDGRKQNEAVFKDLHLIKQAAEIQIVFGNDSVRRFRVLRIQELAIAEAASSLFSQEPQIHRQLNLITCIGTYDKSSRTYDNRFIISAEAL